MPGAECETVVHLMWECSTYNRGIFVEKLRELLGNRYADFDKLNCIEKTAYVIGSELWEYDFDDLLSLVKEYVVGVWEASKQKLYGDYSCPSQLQSRLELRGKGMVSYVPQVREKQMVRICQCSNNSVTNAEILDKLTSCVQHMTKQDNGV